MDQVPGLKAVVRQNLDLHFYKCLDKPLSLPRAEPQDTKFKTVLQVSLFIPLVTLPPSFRWIVQANQLAAPPSGIR